MKRFAMMGLLTLGMLFAGNRTASADPITYNYVGGFYTQTDQPNEAGFTLTDYITVSLTFDSSLWGTGLIRTNQINSVIVSSGPFSAGPYSAVLTTAADGTILSWSIDAEPHGGWDLVTQGNLDGSGRDYNGNAGPPLADGTNCQLGCLAQVAYQSGPRDPGTGWTRVPEPSSLILLGAGIAGIVFVKKLRFQ